MTQHHQHEAAVRYAETGWPVFLLGRTKRPLSNCEACRNADISHNPQTCKCLTCHGFYAATCDQPSIRRMFHHHPSGLLAIRTGTPSGLVVVDIDPGNGGTKTLHTLVRNQLLPPTSYVRTGSAGLHLYYQHPGHLRIPNSAGLLGPGIDIRADGGYVVAPPSRHPRTGRPYTWANPGTKPAEMPRALVEATTTNLTPENPPNQATSVAKLTGGKDISSPDALLTALLNRVRTAPHGVRRTTLYGVARGVARMITAGAITSSHARTTLTEVGRACGQTDREARMAIDGGFRAEGVNL